jgi:PAS domain S-box-containing protein
MLSTTDAVESQDDLFPGDLLTMDRLCRLWKTEADATECLDLMLRKAAKLTVSVCGAVFVDDPLSEQGGYSASFGLPQEESSKPHLLRIKQELKELSSPSTYSLSDFSDSPLFRLLNSTGVKTLLATPLHAGSDVRGLLVLGARRGRYTQEQVDAAHCIARHVVLTHERAIACRQSDDELRFLESICEISSALANDTDLDATLSILVERAATLVGAESTAVGLLEENGRELRCLQAHGLLAPVLKDSVFDATEWPLSAVIESGKPETLDNPSQNPEIRPSSVREWGVTSGMLAPLSVNDKIIGVLAAANKTDARPFTDQDLRLFSTLANYAAAAILNSRLYARAQDTLLKLEAEKTTLAGILANLGDGVVVCDKDHRIILMNRAAEEIMDMRAEDVIGQDMVFLHPEYHLNKMDAEAAGHDNLLHEAKIHLGQKTIRVNTSPVIVGEQYLGLAMVLQDITSVEEIGRTKTEFVSTVAHELRTPLTALKGSIGLVLGQAAGSVDPKVFEMLKIADNNFNRLIRLVDDMMDIAQIESARMSLRMEPVSVYDCAESSVQEMEQIAADKSVKLRLRPVGPLPLVMADRDRLEQVITNLLSNAIKFSPLESGVAVSVRQIHGYVRVSVQDSGSGIPAHDLKKVFDKFYQVGGQSSRQDGGSGLGLAISKAIVEQHGGSIYARSSLGQGSTFVFTIPIASVVSKSREEQNGAKEN